MYLIPVCVCICVCQSVVFLPYIGTEGVGRENSPINQNPDSEPQPASSEAAKSSTPIPQPHVQPTRTDSNTISHFTSDSNVVKPTGIVSVSSSSTKPLLTNTSPVPVSPVPENETTKVKSQNKETPENGNQNGTEHQTGTEDNTDTHVSEPVKNSSIIISRPLNNHHLDDGHLPTRDPCDVHGCDQGSGLIVVGVVVCIAILVVFFVTLIVGRKLYTNRRKKHYHNVDYLINGMYT